MNAAQLSRLGLAAAAIFAFAACSSDDKDVYVERPVEQIYNSGVDALTAERYVAAAKEFDEVDRQHPYSVWATKAQLMAAYAHYQNNKYDDAIVALDRFIQLHPSNRDVAYAYYLKALCYYEQISDVQRDSKMTELSLKSLDEVVRRFPETGFARDARLKIDLTYDHLAGKEMEVGRFYLTRGQYVGAMNRFRVVVDKYQTTSHTRGGAAPAGRMLPGAGPHRGSAQGGGGARSQLPRQCVVRGFLRAGPERHAAGERAAGLHGTGLALDLLTG